MYAEVFWHACWPSCLIVAPSSLPFGAFVAACCGPNPLPGLRWAQSPVHVHGLVVFVCTRGFVHMQPSVAKCHAAIGGLGSEAHHHPNRSPLRGSSTNAATTDSCNGHWSSATACTYDGQSCTYMCATNVSIWAMRCSTLSGSGNHKVSQAKRCHATVLAQGMSGRCPGLSHSRSMLQ